MPDGLLEWCANKLHGNIKVSTFASEVFTQFLGCLFDYGVGLTRAATMLQATVRRTFNTFNTQEGDGLTVTGEFDTTNG